MHGQWLPLLQINNSVSRWQNWVEKWQLSEIIKRRRYLQSVSKFMADTNWRLASEAGSAELHTHHLADRKPSRANSLTIAKLLQNFKLPRCRVMRDEVGEGRAKREGEHHLSQLNRNWLSPSRERCEGWDWIIGLLPRGVCVYDLCVCQILPQDEPETQLQMGCSCFPKSIKDCCVTPGTSIIK